MFGYYLNTLTDIGAGRSRVNRIGTLDMELLVSFDDFASGREPDVFAGFHVC